MPYAASHTWVPGDFIRASWLNLDTLNLADHESRLLVEEAATTNHETRIDALETATPAPTTLAGQSDVALGSPLTTGEALIFNGTSWTNQTAATALNWQGAWLISTAYAADDMVEHNGSSYIATTATTGDEPGVASPDPWDLVAAKGDTGATGATGSTGPQGPQGDPGLIGDWLGEWNSATAYVALDAVQYQGSSYIANTSTTNEAPGTTSPDPWDLVAAKGATGSVGALDDLTDVSAAAPNDGDVLTYQAGSPTGWIASAPAGGGTVVQVVNTQTGAVATGTTIIPMDDTIPQNTEGTEFMTLAITPTDAANKLKIEVSVFVAISVNAIWQIAALFQDATADALAASVRWSPTANSGFQVTFTHYMAAGTTSATTLKLRIGGSASSTVTFNGVSGARYMGGVMASSITITEIVP